MAPFCLTPEYPSQSRSEVCRGTAARRIPVFLLALRNRLGGATGRRRGGNLGARRVPAVTPLVARPERGQEVVGVTGNGGEALECQRAARGASAARDVARPASHRAFVNRIVGGGGAAARAPGEIELRRVDRILDEAEGDSGR